MDRYKNQPNVQYLEIGVYEGRSFFWTLDHILGGKKSHAVAIDVFATAGLENRFLDNVKKSGRMEDISVKKGFSQITLAALERNSFDIIYIDGGHSAKNVITDAILAWPLLKEGGVLIFDDYYWFRGQWPSDLTPKLAIDFFLTTYRSEIQVVDRGEQVFLVKTKDVQFQCWYCSFFGKQCFVYNWYDRTLSSTSKKELSLIKLSTQEQDLIEQMLMQVVYSQTDINISADVFKKTDSIRLLKTLKVPIETFNSCGK